MPQLKDITNIDIVMPTDGSEAAPEDEAIMLVAVDGSLKQAS